MKVQAKRHYILTSKMSHWGINRQTSHPQNQQKLGKGVPGKMPITRNPKNLFPKIKPARATEIWDTTAQKMVPAHMVTKVIPVGEGPFSQTEEDKTKTVPTEVDTVQTKRKRNEQEGEEEEHGTKVKGKGERAKTQQSRQIRRLAKLVYAP